MEAQRKEIPREPSHNLDVTPLQQHQRPEWMAELYGHVNICVSIKIQKKFVFEET